VTSTVLRAALPCLLGLAAQAQAPLLQDGAAALRQARLDWALGQAPLEPSSMPSFEVGWGGADSGGAYAPLVGGEGLGHGTRGWGLGLQGRYSIGGWGFAATVLGLRDQGRTTGVLQRALVGFQFNSGGRIILEQSPLAWGSGLNGGPLLGDAARPFPRVTLAFTPLELFHSLWRLEAFEGRLERTPTVPEWSLDRPTRLAAQTAGLGLQRPTVSGGLLRVSFGTDLEVSLGTLKLSGGQDATGQTAPQETNLTQSLAELRLRLPALARLVGARGASVTASRVGARSGGSLSLVPARDSGGVQLVWNRWDLGLEVAGAAPGTPFSAPPPTYVAGFSTRGDALGAAFGEATTTRTVALGLPLFLEGRGRLQVVRATAHQDDPSGPGGWWLQGDAQWRTPTGRLGASVASRRNELPGAPPRWGWSCSLFQAFRVF
jgi:hypothetical protein